MSDSIAYIPLILTAVIAAALGVLITIIKIKKTAKISFIAYFAILVIIFATVQFAISVINQGGYVPLPGLLTFSLFILLAAALFIPYCIMLLFKQPVQEVHQKEDAEDDDEVELKPQIKIQEIAPESIDLIERGRAFVTMASESFNNEDGMQALLDEINKTCIDVSTANGGAILLVDEFDDIIAVKSFAGDFPPPYRLPEDLPHKPIRVSTSFKYAQFPLRDNIFGEVATAGKAELITIPGSDERIVENGPEEFLKLGSYIFIPLRLRGKNIVIGLLALSKNPGQTFTQKDFDHALTLAGFAESALKTTLSFKQYKDQQEATREIDTAANLQKLLLPKKLPALPGTSVGIFSENVLGVCSDTVDLIPARADRTSFIVMDVAGKGMTSVVVMTMLRSMFRLIVNTTQSAGTILSWANRGICSENAVEHFASIALINYNPVSKKVQLATSGSVPVLRFNVAKQDIEKVSIPCEPVGVEKTTAYRDVEFTANKGDIIIAYTDGLIEALNGQGKQYTVESLAKIIKENNKLPGKDIANLVKTDIKKFVGTEKLHDDQTLLVVKIQ